MSEVRRPLFELQKSDFLDLNGLYEPWEAEQSTAPELVILNEQLAASLGLDIAALSSPEGVATLVGNTVPAGATPVAQAYAGHQFGGFSPRLGDGRALLLGEILDGTGQRYDLHLKGSGRTPFARGGDGKAALGPMLREYIFGEAMHALRIPTTRALAVVATGDQVARDTMLPGAVLARVAASHLRVGTFQYAATHPDKTLVARLTNYAIGRHVPAAAEAENPALAFLDHVIGAQASLVAEWMLVGFIHGVMNTDNVTISGETIDYGPCAFMDAYDPATVFSSIDHGGRYAFGNQPQITQWNLARLAETLLPLIDITDDAAIEAATELLNTFPDRFRTNWHRGMCAKLGLSTEPDGHAVVIQDLLGLMESQRVDFTRLFRSLSQTVLGNVEPTRSMFTEPEAFDEWSQRWQAALAAQNQDPCTTAAAMDQVNPVYIPRNHLVEESLSAAGDGDLELFHRLLEVLDQPFVERPGLGRYTEPAPSAFGRYRTFCGT